MTIKEIRNKVYLMAMIDELDKLLGFSMTIKMRNHIIGRINQLQADLAEEVENE